MPLTFCNLVPEDILFFYLHYFSSFLPTLCFPGASEVKNLPAMLEMQETQVESLGWEDALEEGMATHSSILAWRIPWTEGSGGL